MWMEREGSRRCETCMEDDGLGSRGKYSFVSLGITSGLGGVESTRHVRMHFCKTMQRGEVNGKTMRCNYLQTGKQGEFT